MNNTYEITGMYRLFISNIYYAAQLFFLSVLFIAIISAFNQDCWSCMPITILIVILFMALYHLICWTLFVRKFPFKIRRINELIELTFPFPYRKINLRQDEVILVNDSNKTLRISYKRIIHTMICLDKDVYLAKKLNGEVSQIM